MFLIWTAIKQCRQGFLVLAVTFLHHVRMECATPEKYRCAATILTAPTTAPFVVPEISDFIASHIDRALNCSTVIEGRVRYIDPVLAGVGILRS